MKYEIVLEQEDIDTINLILQQESFKSVEDYITYVIGERLVCFLATRKLNALGEKHRKPVVIEGEN